MKRILLSLLILVAPAQAKVPDDIGKYGYPLNGMPLEVGEALVWYDCDAKEGRCALQELDSRTIKYETDRSNRFFADPRVPALFRSHPADYERSGFDQGHLWPAGDASDQDNQDQSFSLVNMAPQVPGLNRNLWRGIETKARAYADEKHVKVWITTATVVRGATKRIGKGVLVPKGYVKSVVVKKEGHKTPEKAVAWLVRNVEPPQGAKPEMYATTLEQARQECGIKMFPLLPIEDDE